MKKNKLEDEKILKEMKKFGVKRGIACFDDKEKLLEQAKRSLKEMKKLDKDLKSLD